MTVTVTWSLEALFLGAVPLLQSGVVHSHHKWAWPGAVWGVEGDGEVR